MIETVAINFKKSGMKAYLNKSDFDPKIHVLWTDADEKRDAAPLPVPQNAAVPVDEKQIEAAKSGEPVRQARTRRS